MRSSTSRSTPSSVSFCTIQSSRSPFGIEAAIVTGQRRPIGDHDVADHVELQPLRSPADRGRSPPPGQSVTVTGLAGAQAQHPAQVVLDVVVDADDDIVALADAVDDDVGRRTPRASAPIVLARGRTPQSVTRTPT